MQTATLIHNGDRYDLAYDDFNKTLYRQTRNTPNGPLSNEFLHRSRIVDGHTLNVAWLDYLAKERGEGTDHMVFRAESTQKVLYQNPSSGE
ncbi:hypothetical protein ACTXK7_07330 [Vreelandella alkaliphila]|uniref:hypothetical protein n=1 Tax=Halomonadaceae TaxID=28256 RepID=UPI003F8E29B5